MSRGRLVRRFYGKIETFIVRGSVHFFALRDFAMDAAEGRRPGKTLFGVDLVFGRDAFRDSLIDGGGWLAP